MNAGTPDQVAPGSSAIGPARLLEDMMQRNPLLPWYIGLVIIGIIDAYVGYLFFTTRCGAGALPQTLVLVVIPGVYLTLMYLTFKSQA